MTKQEIPEPLPPIIQESSLPLQMNNAGATATLKGRTTFRGNQLSTETEQYWCRIIGALELSD
jgi:hypothetical protein